MTELYNPAQMVLDRVKEMLAQAESAGDTERALEYRTDLARLEHEWAQMEARIRENGCVEGVNKLLHLLEAAVPAGEGEAGSDAVLRQIHKLAKMEPIDDAAPRDDD